MSKASPVGATDLEAIALFASIEGKPNLAKIAALLNVPKPTIEGRVRFKWRGAADALIQKAKAEGRLKADGSVEMANLPKPGKGGKAGSAGVTLTTESLTNGKGGAGGQGVKHGRVEKKTAIKKGGRGRGRKGAPVVSDDSDDVAADLEAAAEMDVDQGNDTVKMEMSDEDKDDAGDEQNVAGGEL